VEDSVSDADSRAEASDDAERVPCRAVACPPPPPPSPEPPDSVELSEPAAVSKARAEDAVGEDGVDDAVGEDGVEGEGAVEADEKGIARVSRRVHVTVRCSLEDPSIDV